MKNIFKKDLSIPLDIVSKVCLTLDIKEYLVDYPFVKCRY